MNIYCRSDRWDLHKAKLIMAQMDMLMHTDILKDKEPRMQNMEAAHLYEYENILQFLLKNIVLILKVCGAYVERGRKNKCRSRYVVHVAYCIAICFIVWMDNLRFLSILLSKEKVDRYMAMGVYAIIYFSKSFFLVYCLRILSKNLPGIYEAFKLYQSKYGLHIRWRKWKLYLNILMSSLLLTYVTLLTVVVVVIKMELLSPRAVVIKLINPIDQKNNFLFTFMAILFAVKALFIFIFHHCMYIIFFVICRMISNEYRKLKEDLKDHDFNEDGNNLDTETKYVVEDFRKRHHAITSLVQISNGVLQHVAAMQYCITIPVTCMVLYGLIYGRLLNDDVVALAGDVIIHFVLMTHLTFTASTLNKEVFTCL